MAAHSRFLLLLLLSFGVLTQAQVSSDTLSLLEFKKGIADDPTGVVRNTWSPVAWDSAAVVDSCPRSWHGISCDESGSVVTVALIGLGLSGEIKFNTIVGLRALQNLSLAGNSFTGRLVPAIGDMTSLQHLDLSGNRFYGPIPRKLTNLWGLVHLNLSSNGFKGGFPAGIQNLQQLRVLDLRSNELWGEVGAVLSELRNVEHVDLSRNNFYGDLFMDSSNLSSLGNTAKYMNLSFNRLNGRFFSNDSIGVFKSLQVLDLSQNDLIGELPSFGSLFNLKVFRAANNLLSGPIPEDLFGDSIQLMELDLSGNGFTGSSETVSSSTLKFLDLSSNLISGQLPSNLANCISVDLSKNMLSGDLTAMQNWGYTLEVIKLSSNDLAGSLPSALGSHPKLSIVDLSLNKLTGSVLPSLFTSLTLTCLNLSGNHFNGSIQFQTSHPTESLTIPYNHLQSLDLSNNSLSGSVPPEISSMPSLQVLRLGKNTLSGELPVEISKLGGLEVLDLSFNHFKGRIPNMLQPDLKLFNVSYNDLSGEIPQSLLKFPMSSFFPGNSLLVFPNHISFGNNNGAVNENMSQHKHSKAGIEIALIVGSIGAVLLIFFLFIAFRRTRSQEFCLKSGLRGQVTGMDVKGIFGHPNRFKGSKDDPSPTSISFSNDHLLTSTSRSTSVRKDLLTESMEYGYGYLDSRNSAAEPSSGLSMMECKSSPGSPLSSSPHFADSHISEQPVLLEVYSPDRFLGELFFLDLSRTFTAEELSRAPAEVLGKSSHGTSYKATLDGGHILTVKWLRAGLVKHKKEFAREARRVGTIRHPNVISWRGYYWGSSDQERLIVSDYIIGDNLALYLYDSTRSRYSRLSVRHRLKVAIDVARSLYHLHNDRRLPHGNLKPTNILLTSPDLTARLTDYGLHRLLTHNSIAEQILNLGALGYRAPELATSKPLPSFKADVYSFGVILMELLTRKCAGDIISGQSGSVDLVDWVQMCAREGRGSDCFDRDIVGLDEAPNVMDELLAVSLRCILPVKERPDIQTIFQELSSITI
ncbi:probable inactive receptor kinase At5g10020 [Phalaenopsis equestris]|uniref:probable inactive receptor kinase At5g10020 n=1 Tax=Phalaenopsis equestris TaxID=78828 RepID=UPI0009E25830|nr:probable inactive receptor kinase At5g10020 [Phalaenopsis equestris]